MDNDMGIRRTSQSREIARKLVWLGIGCGRSAGEKSGAPYGTRTRVSAVKGRFGKRKNYPPLFMKVQLNQ